MPSCAGLCANIELAKISGYVVHEIYDIAPRNPRKPDYETHAEAALKKLDGWHSRLPAQLQIHPDQALRDSACCTMHMTYNQLIILTTRPIFFATIKKLVAQRTFSELSRLGELTHERYARACTEAAERNVGLARLLQSTNKSWLQPGLHFLFNAAVVLLLSRISSVYEGKSNSGRTAEDPYAAELGFAINVFGQEAKTGTNYHADCYRVLQGLKALSDRCVVTQSEPKGQQRSDTRDRHMSAPRSATPYEQRTSHGTNDDATVYQEMLSWAQTDNLQLRATLFL